MFFRKNIILSAAIVVLAASGFLPLRAEVDVQAALTGIPTQSESVENTSDAAANEPAEADAAAEKESIQNSISSISDIDRLFEEAGNFFHKSWDFLNKSRVKIFVLFIGLVLSYFVAMVVNYLFYTIFLRFAKRTKFTYDDQLCSALRSPITTLVFIIGDCLSALPFLSLCPPKIFTLIIRLFLVSAVVDITWGLFRVIDVISNFWIELAVKSVNNIDDLLVQFIRKSAKTILVLVALFLCGETILQLNITALMTTAGIAGLAIAFAAKDTIANFLSSIMIILDKPFKIGDRIRTGVLDGIVEMVGFRSSRIRGLDGNLFIIPNCQLADAAIENVTERPNIRYIFDLTLVTVQRRKKCGWRGKFWSV